MPLPAMNLSDSVKEFGWRVNLSDWSSNSTAGPILVHVVNLIDDPALDNTMDTTDNPAVTVSNKPCGEVLSSQTPAVAKLSGSLDALFYIIIVLLFYAFSIVVLMVKYVRREREEANLRNYYQEFVSREKFQSAQYRNRQGLKRKFSKSSHKDEHALPTVEEHNGGIRNTSQDTSQDTSQGQTLARTSNRFSRLLGDNIDATSSKESFTFLGVRGGLFGKKFCGKQLCSKCVSESVPTIDWDDGRVGHVGRDRQGQKLEAAVELRLCHSQRRHPHETNYYHKSHHKDYMDSSYLHERDNSIFFPIIECESDADNDDDGKQQNAVAKWTNENAPFRARYDATPAEAAIVSSCSLEISNMLAAMPPLNAGSPSNDMDTLDGLSNLDSEAGSQSLLTYSASVKGTNSIYGGHGKDSPGIVNKSGSGDDRLKDLSDFLSERTSLLSCTLSIEDGEDDDVMTNLSSAKHHSHGISLQSSSNGKRKGVLTSNGKSFLNSLSKSLSSDEGDRKKFLSDITNLTEDSGVFKNLKYFLRGFSKDCGVKEAYETLNLLPRETYFGSGSPQSLFSNSKNVVLPAKCDRVDESSVYTQMDAADNSRMSRNECDSRCSRWGYTYDTEDELYSEGDRSSSSFGDYCMGETSTSQVIDLSKPLVRRQLDSETKDVLSRAFVGLGDSLPDVNPPVKAEDSLIPDHGGARKETKV